MEVGKVTLSAVFGTIYAVSSAGETLAVKSLNYASVPVVLPAYTALLSNQMWLLMIPIYYFGERTHTGYDYIMQNIYAGVLTFFITLLRNISVNAIPGSVFSVLISTSILFNMILSWFYLKKTFNRWHMAAAGCCIASAVSIAITAFLLMEEGGNFSVGIPSAIGAALCIAFMNVWQEYMKPIWDNANQRLAEMAIMSSLIASGLIVLYASFVGEVLVWGPVLKTASIPLLVGISIALPVLKLLVRNSKYAAIQHSSAFFFEFVQAASALLGSLANILLFGEPWGHGYIASLLLMVMSFAFYTRAKYSAKKEEAAKVQTDIETMNPIKVSAWT